MKSKVKTLTQQKRELRKALKALEPAVTAEDRALVMRKVKCSKSLVSLYLSGNVYSTNTGIKILQILKTEVAKRQQLQELATSEIF